MKGLDLLPALSAPKGLLCDRRKLQWSLEYSSFDEQHGPASWIDFMNAVGALFPLAPCGGWSLWCLRQASSSSASSAIRRYHWGFVHFVLSRLLSPLIMALSLRLPRMDKSKVTPR